MGLPVSKPEPAQNALITLFGVDHLRQQPSAQVA